MKIHIVKKGDTLYELSKKYNVDLKKLIETNPQIKNPDEIEVGMKVKIPSTPASVGEHMNKKPTEPIQAAPSKKPTEPIQAAPPKKPTEPIQAAPPKKPTEPIQAAPPKKPTEPIQAAPPKKPAEPIQAMPPIKPIEPIQAMPPIKPIEPIQAIQSEKIDDLFDQYKTPAHKVGSFYDIPEIPEMKEEPWGMPYSLKDTDIPGLSPATWQETPQSFLPLQGSPISPMAQVGGSPISPMAQVGGYNPLPYLSMPHEYPFMPIPYEYPFMPMPHDYPFMTMPQFDVPYHHSPYSPALPHHYGCGCGGKRNSFDTIAEEKEVKLHHTNIGEETTNTEKGLRVKTKGKLKKTQKKIIKKRENIPWIKKV